jgi:two-component system, cell cycle sensor histidine kinase and response regulator CckA
MDDPKRLPLNVWRQLVDQLGEGVGLVDSEENFLFVNPAAETIFGVPPETLVGRNLREFVDLTQFRSLRGQTERRQRGKRDTYEMNFLRPDGSRRTLWVTATPAFDERGVFLGTFGSFRDITDRLRAEEELRHARKDWEVIFQALGHPTFILSPQLEVLAVNSAMLRLVGKAEHEIVGRSCFEVMHAAPTSGPPARCPMQTLLAAGTTDAVDMEMEAVGGHFLISCTPVLDEEGRLQKVIHVATNITERKRMEEALRASEKRLDLAMAVKNEGIWDWNLVTNETVFDDRYFTMAGYAPGEFPQDFLGWAEHVHPDDLPHCEAAIQAYLSAESERFEVEFRFKQRDGAWSWIQGRGKIVERDANGAPLRMVGTHTDITERKRAEDEKEKLQAQLIQAQKMELVGRLAGGVAHDFNNMLVVILGHTELALESLDPTVPLHSDLQEIWTAAQRSVDLTRQLLAFARRQTAAPKVLDLNETVEGLLRMLRRLIGEDIDLAWLPGRDTGPVRMDPSQLDQILANLCVNARDAIGGNGKVTIETGAASFDDEYCSAHAGFVPGEYVLLAVSDDGCGMDSETRSHLFEPYFTTKTVGKGTGLGLATVFGIVSQNDGFISVHSEPGQGTTFKIHLPRHRPGSGLPTPAVAASAAPGTETILLVEDEPAIRRVTEKLLRRMGYTVVTASAPGEAIRLAREHAGRIDLLLTDVVMPEMNGRDLAKNVLSLHHGIKSVFMSGYTADVIAHHGVLEEGVHFLQKPFSAAALAAKLREVLG